MNDEMPPEEESKLLDTITGNVMKYGIGNHAPMHERFSPREAYMMSQTTAMPFAQYLRWGKFLRRAVASREYDHLMNEEERDAFASLPDRVTVYRGLRPKEYDPNYIGFSWTLSRDVAERFANEFRKARWGDPNSEPVLLKAEIDKEQIVWLIFERDEREAVIAPDHTTTPKRL